jgi:acyl dehydratase
MVERRIAPMGEIKALQGKKSKESLEIDKHMIRLLCDCIGDPNPKWKDTAPPSMITTAMISGGALALGIPLPFKRSVAAGADWDFFKPIKAGDTINTTHEFFEIQDKSSDKGPRALMVYKSTHTNQKGEVLAVSTNTIMSY